MRNKTKPSRKGDCLRELSFISRLYFANDNHYHLGVIYYTNFTMPLSKLITELESLETLIRNGQEPNKPNILYKYLEMGEGYAESLEPKKYQTYTRLYKTLVDTISDPLVDINWRQLCLDNIHRPLQSLDKLAVTKSEKIMVNRLYRELNVVCQYFFYH